MGGFCCWFWVLGCGFWVKLLCCVGVGFVVVCCFGVVGF